MTAEVICSIALTLAMPPHEKVVVKARGLSIRQSSDTWLVDFAQFIKNSVEYKDYNDFAQEVDSNACQIVKTFPD